MDKAVKKTIMGVEVTFQRPSAKERSIMLDKWTVIKNGYAMPSQEIMYQELMEKVVVWPQIDWEYYDENEDFCEEVLGEAYLIFLGRRKVEVGKALSGEGTEGVPNLDSSVE